MSNKTETKPDYLAGAKDALDLSSVLFSPELASAQALIAIAERLDKQNELLERIANKFEVITGDDTCNALNIWIAGRDY